MFLALYVLSIIATVFLAVRYNFLPSAIAKLLLLSICVPFVGLAYTLYVVFVVRPRLIAEANGLPQPVPFFVPYLEKVRHTILSFWGYILGLLGRKPPRID